MNVAEATAVDPGVGIRAYRRPSRLATRPATSSEGSEGTVRRRHKRLIREGIIRIATAPNLERLGYRTEALVGIQVDPDRIDAVADRLVALRSVSLVTETTGAFDFFVWITLHSSADLGRFLTAEVSVVPGVRGTETFVSLAVRKRTIWMGLSWSVAWMIPISSPSRIVQSPTTTSHPR